MRSHPMFLLLLVAACADPAPSAAERLEARRVALGLETGPVSLAAAMRELKARGLEARLEAGTADGDDALRVENLLRRAIPRELDGFAAARDAAADRALALARGEAGAREVYVACVACHTRFRE